MRDPHEVDCKHAHERFSSDGRWGLGAYDDPESSSAGGKPWCECWCMTTEENEEAAEALNQAWIANKKFDHSTVQTSTSAAPSGVRALAALDDVLAAMEKFKPKDEWVLLTPEGQCMKGTYQQIWHYMATRHPLMKDAVMCFHQENGYDKEELK